MEHVIGRLSDHYIVCGYGRMGEQIGRELTRRALAFVVIEREPRVLEMLRMNNIPYVEGMRPAIVRCSPLAWLVPGD
jgi:voltage-gated potassium channel